METITSIADQRAPCKKGENMPIPVQLVSGRAVKPGQLPLAVVLDAAEVRLARVADMVGELRDQLAEVRRNLSAGTHDDLLRAGEVAALIKLPERVVQELGKAGEIPAVDVRGCLRFPAVGVEEWLRRTPAGGEL